MDFVVFPPGHGSSVTDFWGWDAHETQLRCPDDVSGDIAGWRMEENRIPKMVFIIYEFWNNKIER
jgi:hypothetical protein